MNFTSGISSKLPKRIEHGESAGFFVPFDDKSKWESDFKELRNSHQGDVRKIKACATLVTGGKIKFKISFEILNDINKAP